MGTKPTEWTDVPLFEGGYTHLTIELKAHLDGPAGTWEVWTTISDTLTGELVACESRPSRRGADLDRTMAGGLRLLLERARHHLLPF